MGSPVAFMDSSVLSGTLNLDIKLKFINYLAENFEDVNSIDWNVVARAPYFAGHTVKSLKTLFFKRFCAHFRNNTEDQEFNLENLAKFVQERNYTQRTGEKFLKRQLKIIE